ncbi:ABC transporter permease [Nesterenkonia marinintestina]|uniref:ABC transporter permease n=1 Tax=Nesterenkonia marinintestina TaxID=2979865 RepID=UPI0021C028C6|nr:iron ABC transporter permease [Nesterenkonia sp. GX14115]
MTLLQDSPHTRTDRAAPDGPGVGAPGTGIPGTGGPDGPAGLFGRGRRPVPRRRGPARLLPAWMVILAVVTTAVALLPLFYLVVRAAEYPTADFIDTVFSARSGRLAVSSAMLTTVVTGLCLVIGVGLAVLVTRTRIPGRRLLAVAAALPLAVPSYVAAYSWQSMNQLVSPGTTFEGFWPAVAVITLVTYPYVYLPTVAALLAVGSDQEEAARSLGRGPVHTFLTVTVRQATPAIASGGLLCAIYVIADFGAVAILRVDTFTRVVYTSFSMGFDRIGAVALSTVLLALTMGVLFVEGRIRRTATRYSQVGSGSGGRPARAPLGRWRVPALAAGWAPIVVALGVPVAALSLWSGRGVSRPGSMEEVLGALINSLWAAGAGALATTAIALPLALCLARRPSLLSRSLERMAYLAHSLPGPVVGLSVVMLGIAVLPMFYQTMWMLVLAYCTLMLPLALGPALAAALHAPPELEEAARSLGRPPLIAYLRVTLPLMAPGIGAGAMMVMLTAIKELPATLMLRPTGFDTLATRLWTYTGSESYAAAAPFALLLVLVASVPVWLLVSRLLKEV